MSTTTTKKTSLFAVTLAAILVTGCLPENSEDPNNPDPGPDADFYDENGWELVWSDEFDGTVIDDSKWAFEVNCWGGGNDEAQCYTDSPDNAYVEDGILNIKAIRESVSGPELNPDSPDYDPSNIKEKSFSSARLRSVSPYDFSQGEGFHFENDWTYGRMEVRAKVPSGQGTWAAAWMLPTDWEFGGWAMSGEIDILEAVNIGAQSDAEGANPGDVENRVYGTLHFGRAWPGNVHSGVEYDALNPAADFHTYTIEWEEGAIRWFVDDVHYATQTKEGWYTHYQDENGVWQSSGATAAPFNQDFHIILNLAMGGAWAGNVNETGIDGSINEALYQVDYVRVYQCEDDPSGVSCGTKGEEGTYELQSGVVEPLLPAAADFTADPLVIFEDTLSADWQVAKWDGTDGGDEYSLVEPTDTEDGYIDLQFDNTGVMYLYSNEGKLDDFSSYAGDYTFDIRWVDGTATGLEVGINDDQGNYAHVVLDQQFFGDSGVDTWTPVTIPVADMITNAAGIDLERINIAGKFAQVGGSDLHVQVKNINVSQGDYVAPEPEDLGLSIAILGDALAEGYSVENFWNGEDGEESITENSGVYSVVFTGVGNMGISAASAMDLSQFSDGTLKFDLKVTDLGDASELVVKLDSGWPALAPLNLSDYKGSAMAVDADFVSYEIPVADFVAAGIDGFDISGVLNPFVLEPVGGNIQFDFKNVRFERDLDILSATLAEGYSVENFWNGNDGGETITENGGVYSVAFTGVGNMGISASSSMDLSEFTGGHLTFDLKVTNLGDASELVVKLDSGWPALAPLNLSAYKGSAIAVDADFVSYEIPVADFVAAGVDGFDIAAVVNPFVLEPVGGNIQFDFKNVTFSH